MYGQGAWRNTLLLTALLAVLILGLVLKKPPEKPLSAAAANGQADPRAGELARLKMLGRALKLHADEHDGKFPASIASIEWRQTMPGMDWDGLPAAASRFHHPGSGKAMDWLYYAGHTENDPPDTILAAGARGAGSEGGPADRGAAQRRGGCDRGERFPAGDWRAEKPVRTLSESPGQPRQASFGGRTVPSFQKRVHNSGSSWL